MACFTMSAASGAPAKKSRNVPPRWPLKENFKRSAERTQPTAEKHVVRNQQQTTDVPTVTECICYLHKLQSPRAKE